MRTLAGSFSGGMRRRLNRAGNVFEASNKEFLQRLAQKVSWADVGAIKSLLAPYDSLVSIEEFLGDVLDRCPYRDNFYKLMYFNLKVSLPDDMLVKVDRMSMAHSLEVRAPFLDHRLVEYLVGVDKNLKLRGYERKAILRDTIGKRLPPVLLTAPKRGFGVPIGEWFQGSAFDEYARELLAPAGFQGDQQVLGRIVRDNAAGRQDHGNFLWILMLLSRFCRSEEDRADP